MPRRLKRHSVTRKPEIANFDRFLDWLKRWTARAPELTRPPRSGGRRRHSNSISRVFASFHPECTAGSSRNSTVRTISLARREAYESKGPMRAAYDLASLKEPFGTPRLRTVTCQARIALEDLPVAWGKASRASGRAALSEGRREMLRSATQAQAAEESTSPSRTSFANCS